MRCTTWSRRPDAAHDARGQIDAATLPPERLRAAHDVVGSRTSSSKPSTVILTRDHRGAGGRLRAVQLHSDVGARSPWGRRAAGGILGSTVMSDQDHRGGRSRCRGARCPAAAPAADAGPPPAAPAVGPNGPNPARDLHVRRARATRSDCTGGRRGHPGHRGRTAPLAPDREDRCAHPVCPAARRGARGRRVDRAPAPRRRRGFRGRIPAMLTALAGHVSIALCNGDLVDRLREQVDENSHQAQHDALTGLPNRLGFDRVVLQWPRHRRRPPARPNRVRHQHSRQRLPGRSLGDPSILRWAPGLGSGPSPRGRTAPSERPC